MNSTNTPVARFQWLTIGGLLVFSYARTMRGMIHDWYEFSTFSYGFLVPVIAAYLISQRWQEVKRCAVAPNLWAGLPLMFAVAVGLVGAAIGDTFSPRVAMLLALGSIVWLLFGHSVCKLLLFPWLYLGLMIPVPYGVTKEIAYQLRFFDAILAANALQLLGFPVYRDAYFLHLPNITLEVADMCAGLASIFALFALGAFYAYSLRVSRGAKIILILATVPIAIASNLLRIIVVSVLAFFIGPAALEMTFHRFSGTTTFLGALILLVFAGELLRKHWPEIVARENARRDDDATGTVRALPQARWRATIIGVTALFCAIAGSVLLDGRAVLALPSHTLEGLPQSIGAFKIVTASWEDRYSDEKADNALSRMYASAEGPPVELFIGYRGGQSGGERLGSPKLMLPDKWNFEWVKPARIYLDDGKSIDAQRMLTRSGATARLILYWYHLGGRTVSGELEYRIEQAKRSVIEGRSDAAVVRLATGVRQDETIEQAERRLLSFASPLYRELTKVLPQ